MTTPPPPRRRPRRMSRPGRIAAAALATLLAGLLVVAALLGPAVLREYPARITVPAAVAGLSVVPAGTDGPAAWSLPWTARLGAVLATAAGGAVTTAAYAPPGDSRDLVLVAASAAFSPDPGGRLDRALAALSTMDVATSGLRAVPPGRLGGTVRCGSARVTGIDAPFAVCGWADHGSTGVALFVNRTAANSASLFAAVRAAMLHRR